MFHSLEQSPSKGYQLIDLGSHWELRSSTGVFIGDLKKVCTYAVVRLGFSFTDLNVAVEEIGKNYDKGHNAAEFGIYKHFMFTYEREENDERGTVH